MGKYIKFFFILLVIIVIILVGAFFYFSFPACKGKVSFTIPRGCSVNKIGDILERSGAIRSSLVFNLWLRILGYDRKILAGSYEVKCSPVWELIKKLRFPKLLYLKITIPEGMSNKELADYLSTKYGFNKKKLFSAYRDKEIIARYHIPSDTLEGFLYPNTYFFPVNIGERKLVEYLVKEFFKEIDVREGEKLAVKVGLKSFYEALILASIVEKEAKVEDEKPIIARVFLNRLKKGMPLEACPTIWYIIGHRKDKRLYYRDLRVKSPYNTYIHKGLPPTPISNPSKSTIYAVLHPANVSYLYFVSRNDGSGRHFFSNTLREHIRAKRKYLRK